MSHTILRAPVAVSADGIASMALAACAGGDSGAPAASGDSDFEPLTSVKLQLQWPPQAQFAGYYLAPDKGYLEAGGFGGVEIVASGGDIVPQDALVAGIPDARLIVYEGGGHAFHWEDPATFARDLAAFAEEVA